MALGETDYGLIGVVGGLTAFVSFLNGIMAGGIGRFYAISVGAERQDPMIGLEKCREWFTTAVIIHTVLPIMLMLIGYPLGEWAVRHFLAIPIDRIDACVWVWRYTCLSCIVAMMCVPYQAMYGAKQEIAELTIYSFITTTANFIFLYYMITHARDWLTRYALWACLLQVIPTLVIAFRSLAKYPECRFRRQYINCWRRIKEMCAYSCWLIVGTLADVFGNQGVNVFINKLFGPRINAAATIGNTLSSQCSSLSGSLIGAFGPAIMNAYGAGNMNDVRVYSNRVCKLATLMLLIFAIPLALEIDEVLTLWLKSPPQHAAGLCILALAFTVVDKMAWGYSIAVHAVGRIGLYQIIVGGIFLLSLPGAWLFYKAGCGVYSAAISLVVFRIAGVIVRTVFAQHLVGISFGGWIKKIVSPLLFISLCSALVGALPRCFVNPSLMRVVITTMLVECILIPLSWGMLLGREERVYLANHLRAWGRRLVNA